ncbi:hypothetical protein MOQ72_41435 [Saccharopolyspora sp. K220]|nr:hypothetical protein [Saccharopolyspora soli]MCI2423883.1 hypothetical protein [Saccharopolyspora soli]
MDEVVQFDDENDAQETMESLLAHFRRIAEQQRPEVERAIASLAQWSDTP